MKFTIPGAPLALQRARTGKHGFYDPQAHIKTAMAIHLSHYTGPLLTGPQALLVTFYMPIPKTASKAKIKELVGSYHTYRPDGDNLEKFLLDFCTSAGNIFKDDACIAATLWLKIWELNNNARTEFELIPLQKNNPVTLHTHFKHLLNGHDVPT